MNKKKILSGFSIKVVPRNLSNFAPDLGYSRERDGDIDKYIPSLIENRFQDIDYKLHLMEIAYQKLLAHIEFVKSKVVKLESTENEEKYDLEFGEEYFEILLLTDAYIFEAYSILCLFGRVISYLFPHINAGSPGDFLKRTVIETISDREYKSLLYELQNEEWVAKYISNVQYTSQAGLRTIGVHFSQLKLNPLMDSESGELILYLSARKGVDSYFPMEGRYNLLEVLTSIRYGQNRFIEQFLKVYRAKNHYPTFYDTVTKSKARSARRKGTKTLK